MVSIRPEDLENVTSGRREFVDTPYDRRKGGFDSKYEGLRESDVSVLSYNVFGNAPPLVREFPCHGEKTWHEVRMSLFYEEIAMSRASIVCLQDVNPAHEYEWVELLKRKCLWSRFITVPGMKLGMIIAWDSLELILEEIFPVAFGRASAQQDGSFGVVANICEDTLSTSGEYTIVTAKLCDKPKASYERLRQMTLLLAAAHGIYDGGCRVIAADFNSDQSSPLYQIFVERMVGLNVLPELTNSVLSACRGDVGQAHKKAQELLEQAIATRDKFPPLRSVYKSKIGKEPSFTRWSSNAKGTYDYILVSDNIETEAVFEPLSYVHHGGEYSQPFTLPYFSPSGQQGAPSDHIPIAAIIRPSASM